MMKHDDFERIYGEYYVSAMKVAYYVVGNYDSAQDVVQDVFIKMYQKFPLVDERLIHSWLVLNIKRRAIDVFRKKQTFREVSGRDKDLQRAEGPGGDPEVVVDRVDAELFCGRVLAALQKKNLRWYEILVRISIEGADPVQVAKEYGQSVRHVRTTMHRARVWIRNEFGVEYHDLQ